MSVYHFVRLISIKRKNLRKKQEARRRQIAGSLAERDQRREQIDSELEEGRALELALTEELNTPRGKQVVAKTPMGRFGDQSEVYGCIHYLLSDAASFVTGAIIPVDGGFSSFSGI